MVVSLLCLMSTSCTLFNSIEELKDEDLRYLDRADYISKATAVVEKEYPESKGLLKDPPQIYRAAYIVDRIFDHQVEVSWSINLSPQKTLKNPIKFRNITVQMQRDGKVLDHRSGIVTGDAAWGSPSIESLLDTENK